MGSDAAVEFAGKLDEADAAMERAAGQADTATESVGRLGGEAETASGKVSGLGGEADVAAGKLRGAQGAADDLASAIRNIPSTKTITITMNTVGRGDLAPEFQTESPRFVFQTALENLVAFARNNSIDIDINLPTEKLEKFSGAIDTLKNAITSLADLGDALADLGSALEGLGAAAVYGTPTDAFGQITFVLERLVEWARMIQGVLVDIVARMPEIEEKTQEAIDSTADFVSAMDD